MNSESLRRFAAYSVRKPLNNYVQFIGPERPFSEYSKDDIDGLIQIVLDSYHTKLKDFYEGALKV